MSHIGCRNNITQPTGQCFGCKYWKPARKTLFLSTSGRCTLSYCKKNSVYNIGNCETRDARSQT